MANFTIGLSALRSSQFAMDIVSNNVANANTDGYHRQNVKMRSLPPNLVANFRIGNGVEIGRIHRVRDTVTEDSLTRVIADSNHVDQALTVQRNIESSIMAGENALGRQLDELFGAFTNLSGSPDDPALRGSTVESANRLATSLRDAAGSLDELRQSVRLQIDAEVKALNIELRELSSVSQQVFEFAVQGIEHHAELDERDAIVNRIAEMVGIARQEKPDGQFHVRIGSHSIQQGNHATTVTVTREDNQIQLRLDESDSPLPIDTGRLGALVQAYNEMIPAYQEHLDQVATSLIHQVNSVHATGVGAAGPFEHLLGNVQVPDTSIPLAEALPDAPLTAGDLTVTLHDSSGNRQLHTVAFDPVTDSLSDLAAALNAIPDLHASIRTDSNQLQITAVAGNTFDFAGGVESVPDSSLITGTSVPSLSGVYTGSDNEEITVRIEGSGTVGNSSGLFGNVFSSSGALLQRVSLGTGYEPGSTIELEDGVRLSFGQGTLNNNDEFTTRLAGNGDETGLLGSLGVNAFFKGANARTIRVDDVIAGDPARIASGKTGEVSDASNLSRFMAIDDLALMPNNRTMTQFVSEVTTELGFEIQSNTTLNTSLTNYKLRLEQERDSKSGVDLNEELVYLQEYQKSYEAAIRVIQVTDQMLNELISMLR